MALLPGVSSRTLLASALAWCQLSPAGAQLLPGHSISSIDAQKLTVDWYMAGVVAPTADSLVLSPGVSERVGALWSTTPLLTNSFEVTLKLKGRKASPRFAKEAGFAFWLSPDNGTNLEHNLFENHAQNTASIEKNSWLAEFNTGGCDLLGFKSQFKGLGVFFLDEEAGPSMSAAIGDGSKSFKLGAGVPTTDVTKFDFLNDQEHTVKITILPDSAKIELVGQPALTVKGAFASGSFMGITSFGGNKLTPQSEAKTFHASLTSLSVVNNDKSAKGEEVSATPPPPVPEDEKQDVIAKESDRKDHRAESDAIKDLTNVVFKLVVETQPMRHAMEKAISSLSKRIDGMEKSFEDLKVELDKKTGHHLSAEFESIKDELSTLSDVASKETKERHSRLETLHADIADVHKSAHSPDNIDKHLDKLTVSNDKVLDQLTNEHQTMFGFSVAAIGFIIISGLSLYNKFRCWEKKHVL